MLHVVLLLPIMHSFNKPEAAISMQATFHVGFPFFMILYELFVQMKKCYFCRFVNCTQPTVRVHGVVMLPCVTMDAMT